MGVSMRVVVDEAVRRDVDAILVRSATQVDAEAIVDIIIVPPFPPPLGSSCRMGPVSSYSGGHTTR